VRAQKYPYSGKKEIIINNEKLLYLNLNYELPQQQYESLGGHARVEAQSVDKVFNFKEKTHKYNRTRKGRAIR
jgi:hypothetical protein